MPYIDGLPIATTAASTDVVAIAQGGIPGIPGTATPKQITVEDLLVVSLSVSFLAFFNSLPTEIPSEPGVAWNNGGVLQVS